ncbi:hypothetical protein [Thermoactinomyces sp. CICC 10521]|uniref:hypothetical protein n=1 Tax=Thermoactinomyces sp. CICC 10521 TaxID=2767426 RepID=UPI0018DBCCCD|nr:hypothetical protein [Thermoactinomyces sp. CICC 10521]MBH8608737.1 hypothetical protein [Thermoactinomyces sp. CICC 10521]
MRRYAFHYLLLIFLLVVPGSAHAAGAIENMLPDHSPINENGSITDELYEKFDVDNYTFDGNYDVTSIFNKTQNFVLSNIYVAEIFLLKVGIYIFQWASQAPFFDYLASWTSGAVKWMGGNIFITVLKSISILVSLWILVEIFRKRYADSAKSLLTSLVFLALSMVLFNNMNSALHFVNNFSNHISAQILAIVEPSKQGDVNKEVVVKSSNKIWENYAIIPWQFGEFGKSMKPGSNISADSKDKIAKDTYLILSANDNTRSDYVDKWTDDPPRYPSMNSDSGLTGRSVVVIVTLVTDTIFVIFLITLSLFQLFYKLAFLILAFIAPLVCLFAAWPRSGVWTVINWGYNWVGAGLYGIVVSFLIAFYLGISTKLYELVPKMGWFFGGIVPQLVLVIMLVMFRKQLIQFFRAPVRQTKRVYGQMNRYFAKGEPLVSQSRQFAGTINRAFDSVEKKLRSRPAAANSGSGQSSGFSKPYLQSSFTDQNKKEKSAYKSQPFQNQKSIDPEIIPPKELREGQKHGPTIIDAEYSVVDDQEPLGLPDKPTRGRIINGKFLPAPAQLTTAPQSTTPKAKQKPKKRRLVQLNDEQKRKLKTQAVVLAGKAVMKMAASKESKPKK